jgi:hypothetical protein
VDLIFSIIQFLDAHRHTHALKTNAESLTTTYQGEFPNFIPTIVEKLIKQATESLLITCDFSCQGFFSAYELHVKYDSVIRNC